MSGGANGESGARIHRTARGLEAEAFGKPAGTVVRMTCYMADYTGTLAPDEEIEELAWIQSNFPLDKLSEAGRMILKDLKQKDLID